MLYERWQMVVSDCRNETALRDLASGRSWTFSALDAAAQPAPDEDSPAQFPDGRSAAFVLTVLRAWRHDRVVCPQEAGASRPDLRGLPKDCRLVKTTSATTGAPRLVLFNESQMAADADHIVRTMGLRRDWPNLGFISLAHSYGFSNLVLPLLLHGIPLVLAPGPLPETLRQAAAAGRDWTLAAVPALWRAWHEAGSIPRGIRLAISAGAPLPLPLEQAVFDSTGVKIHNFLGSSECGGIAYDRSETPRADATLAGAPMDGVQLERDPDGCLVVRSDAVGMTCWPDADDRLADGCFRTRDLAELRDGLVFLQGRASDLINVAGRKVSPESVERVLLRHADVRECLVLGLPAGDASRGELVAAVVVLRRDLKLETLKAFALEHLPDWQAPKRWHVVESLGVNERGKLSRAGWRRRLQSQDGTQIG